MGKLLDELLADTGPRVIDHLRKGAADLQQEIMPPRTSTSLYDSAWLFRPVGGEFLATLPFDTGGSVLRWLVLRLVTEYTVMLETWTRHTPYNFTETVYAGRLADFSIKTDADVKAALVGLAREYAARVPRL